MSRPSQSIKKCLVTGGAGFIGSNMVDRLLFEGHQVRVLDNLSTGDLRNLEASFSKIEWIEGDIRDEAAVRQAMEGTDYVFHMAANRAVGRSVDDPRQNNDVNITGTLNILIAARDFAVKRVIFSSSSAVYGDTHKFPSEEMDMPYPQSPYGASKLMGEHYCRLFSELYGLETVSLRYFNVFGPRQNPESRYSCVIPIFIEAFVNGHSPDVHWDGKQSRDFASVDNIIEGNMSAMRAANLKGDIFNISCHEEYSLLDILETLEKIMQKKCPPPTFTPKRPGDVRRTLAKIEKAQKILGFQVKTSFEEGLRQAVNWFVQARPEQDAQEAPKPAILA